jgi:hypothetical protein
MCISSLKVTGVSTSRFLNEPTVKHDALDDMVRFFEASYRNMLDGYHASALP